VAPNLSLEDEGPFRLIHPDFGHNNIIIDDSYSILGVIDWEGAFVGPSEMAAQFPLRLQLPPEDISQESRDSNGVIENPYWRKRWENRAVFMEAISTLESRLGSLNEQKLSSSMVTPQADVLYLIRLWEQGVSWLLKYEPEIAREAVGKILEKVNRRRWVILQFPETINCIL